MSSSSHLPIEPPWPKETGTWATYNLHCHCGAVRYNISVSPPLYRDHDTESKGIYTVGSCDCSFCERTGYLSIHPKASNVHFTQGKDDISHYQFGAKKGTHFFCRKCGSVVATDLREMMESMGQEERYTINVRMLKDFDMDKLTVRRMEFMKAMPPKYEIDGVEASRSGIS